MITDFNPYIRFIINQWSGGNILFGDIVTLLNYCKGKYVVELGTNTGSTTSLISTVADKIITIDIFENVELIENDYQKLKYYKMFVDHPHYYSDINKKLSKYNNVLVFNDLSFEVAKKIKNETIDVLFVDGDHSFDGVKKDYDAWFDKLKIGGIFLFHDCTPDNIDHTGVWKFYNDVLKNDNRIKEVSNNIGDTVIKIFERSV